MSSLRQTIADVRHQLKAHEEDQSRANYLYVPIVDLEVLIAAASALEQEGVDAALPEERSDDTPGLSSERRRGLEEALTPSAETKAAYTGEFTFYIGEDQDGVMVSRAVVVPWTTIKDIMAAIKRRSLSTSSEGGEEKT